MKKRILTLVSLSLVLAFVFATYQPASAQFITDTEYSIGSQGINVPAGFDPDVYYIRRASGVGPVFFSRQPIELVQELEGLMPFTYVFYDLKKWEARAWRDGELNIWHRSPSTGFWNTCNSFQIGAVGLPRGEGVGPDGMNASTGDRVRIACVATEPGVYGVGSPNMRVAPPYGVGR